MVKLLFHYKIIIMEVFKRSAPRILKCFPYKYMCIYDDQFSCYQCIRRSFHTYGGLKSEHITINWNIGPNIPYNLSQHGNRMHTVPEIQNTYV